MSTFAANPITNIIDHKGFKILCVSEIRGQLSQLNSLARKHNASAIIHTGNFGFFDTDSITKIHESYLRHIVAFSPFISKDIKSKVNQLSKINEHGEINEEERKVLNHVKDEKLSELDLFLKGIIGFNVPVYAIHGMIEDNSVINKFKLGIYKIKNLHLIDENSVHEIKLTNGNNHLSISLFGIGGALNISKLFFHGTFDDSIQNEIKNIEPSQKKDPFFIPTSGDPGNLWITMLQIGKLLKTMKIHQAQKLKSGDGSTAITTKDTSIRIFVSHTSPVKEPLLEHLAIYLKSDYTISNSLHFLYSSSYNELSICPTYESFKNKFIDAKTQLLKIWKNIKSTIGILVNKSDNPNKVELLELFDLALTCFDKIPSTTTIPVYTNENKSSCSRSSSSATSPTTDTTNIASSDSSNNASGASSTYQNVSFSLNSSVNSPELLANNSNAKIQKHINDSYYSAFQNLWHFNLCDFDNGYILLNCVNDRISMESFSVGFDFSFRHRLSLEDVQGMDKQKERDINFLDTDGSVTIESSQRKSSATYDGQKREVEFEDEDEDTTYNEDDDEYNYDEGDDEDDYEEEGDDEEEEDYEDNDILFESDKSQQHQTISSSAFNGNSLTIHSRNHNRGTYRHNTNKTHRVSGKQTRENLTNDSASINGDKISIKPYYSTGYGNSGNKFGKNKPNGYSKSKSTNRSQNWKTLKESESKHFEDNSSNNNLQSESTTYNSNGDRENSANESFHGANNESYGSSTSNDGKNDSNVIRDEVSEATLATASNNKFTSNGRYIKNRGGSNKPASSLRGSSARGRGGNRGSRSSRGRRGGGGRRGGSRSESSSSAAATPATANLE